MKNTDLIDQFFIFLASISTTIYAIFSKDEKQAISRALFASKILGGVILAFFIMPGVMEWFELTIKTTLLITVCVAYGLESILKASVKKIIKTIDKDGDDISKN